MNSVEVTNIDARTTRKTKAGGRSATVARMLLTNRRTTIFMALLLPLGIGLTLTLTGLIIVASTRFTAGNLSQFYTENVVHQVVMSIVFAATSFMTVSKNLTLVLSMGFTRTSFWRGYVRASSKLALLSTAIYVIFGLIEKFTLGYFVGWQVMAPSFDLIFMFNEPLGVQVLELIRYIIIWFSLLMIVQLLGAVLALINLRWGHLRTSLCALLFLICLSWVSRQLFGTIYYDLGLHQLFFPYYYQDNQQIYYSDILETISMMKNEQGYSVTFPFRYYLLYTTQFALISSLGVVFSYLMGAICLKKTNLR